MTAEKYRMTEAGRRWKLISAVGDTAVTVLLVVGQVLHPLHGANLFISAMIFGWFVNCAVSEWRDLVFDADRPVKP